VPARKSFSNWEGRLSLDWRTGPDGLSHTLELFQESAGEQILDLRFWFDELRIADPVQNEIAFDDFVSRGVRWWDALYAGDPRTAGHGIVPLGPENEG
jgi:hypothetical protein